MRFVAEGERHVASDQAQHALSTLVQSVLTQLHEQGIHDTPLAKEWDAIIEADADETAFCLAAARLGLDPYAVSDEDAARIVRIGEALEESVLDDFLDAVDPARIEDSLRWVERATQRVRTSNAPPQAFAELRAPYEPTEEDVFAARPWEAGYRQARRLRDRLARPVTERFDPDVFVGVGRTPPDPTITGLGGWSAAHSGVVILGNQLRKPSRRFAQARALWHFVHEPDRPRFLIVPAVTDRHRTERAFAAELLAPAEGIAALLAARHVLVEADHAVVDEDQLTGLAQHFAASSWVIRHQIENQLAIPVLDL